MDYHLVGITGLTLVPSVGRNDISFSGAIILSLVKTVLRGEELYPTRGNPDDVEQYGSRLQSSHQ